MRLLLPVIFLFSLGPLARAEEFTGIELTGQEAFVDQGIYSDAACGPTALLNSLKFGGESYRDGFAQLPGATDQHRLHSLVDRYFKRPSSILPQGRRYSQHSGVLSRDLLVAAQETYADLGLPKVEGQEFLRGEDEPSEEFIQRVHRQLQYSLFQGMTPIIELRSQYADQDSVTGQWKWKAMEDHYVVVTRVPKQLREDAMGFSFDYIDPLGGKLGTAFVYAERRQNFSAWQGDTHLGRWLAGNRFLLINAPSAYGMIPDEKADWHARTLTALSYYIGL